MQCRVMFLTKRWHFLVPFGRSGLRARMTISYMLVTLGSLFTFLILAILINSALSVFFSDPLGDRTFLAAVQQQAQSYALAAAVQAQGVALDLFLNRRTPSPYRTRRARFMTYPRPMSRKDLLIQHRAHLHFWLHRMVGWSRARILLAMRRGCLSLCSHPHKGRLLSRH